MTVQSKLTTDQLIALEGHAVVGRKVVKLDDVALEVIKSIEARQDKIAADERTTIHRCLHCKGSFTTKFMEAITTMNSADMPPPAYFQVRVGAKLVHWCERGVEQPLP